MIKLLNGRLYADFLKYTLNLQHKLSFKGVVYNRYMSRKSVMYVVISICVVVFSFLGFFIYKKHVTSFFETPFFFTEDTVSVLNFGDVMFDRGVRNIMEKRGRDPFEYIKKDLNIIKDFDVVIANLEGPIVEMNRADCQQKAYNFQFASTTPALLKSIGITMVNIANNHSNDCFRKGFESTKKYLTDAGIEYIGDREIEKSFIVKMIAGKKVAFVGMDETISPLYVSNFYPLVKKLKSENDIVIVNIHWGTEYELTETEVQRTIAHALVDNGADVIFGHHPHVIEPVEVYKKKVIFYSLGNFVFDQTGIEQTRGLGAGVRFGEKTNTFTLFPYVLKSFAPEFLKGDKKDAFCETYLHTISHTACVFEVVI